MYVMVQDRRASMKNCASQEDGQYVQSEKSLVTEGL